MHGRATFPAQPKVVDSAMGRIGSRSTAHIFCIVQEDLSTSKVTEKRVAGRRAIIARTPLGNTATRCKPVRCRFPVTEQNPPRAEPIEAESGVILVIGADLSMIGKTTCGTSLKGNVILRNYRELCSAFSFSSRRSCVSFPVAGLHPKDHLSLRSPPLELEG